MNRKLYNINGILYNTHRKLYNTNKKLYNINRKDQILQRLTCHSDDVFWLLYVFFLAAAQIAYQSEFQTSQQNW